MTRFSAWESFCITTRVWFLDILWPLAKLGVELTTLVYFWYADHHYWAMLLTGSILMPGIIEVIYWSVTTMYNCRRKGCCYWSFLFNPILYPFTMMAWNVSVITSGIGVYEEKYSISRVLTMIQTISKSVLLMIAQIYILLQTWRFSLMNIFQGLSALMCAITISKEFGEHHFHELSGKTDIPSIGQITAGFFFYFVQIILRLPCLVLLTVCLAHWVLIFVAVFVLLNFLVAFKLKTDVSKNIWTSFASLVAPVCFVGKHKIPHYKHAGDTFHRYYLWNSLTFFILSLLSNISLNFLLVYGNDEIGKWLLANIRLVHILGDGCFASGQICPGVHIVSTIAVICSLLQPMFVWAQPFLFPVMIGQHFPKTSSIIDL